MKGRGKITPQDGKPFVKGDTRINRAGRPKKLPDLNELLIEVLGERIEGKEAMKSILIALRKKAIAGDVRATELLLNRAYGLLRQSNDFKMDMTNLSDTDLNRLIKKILPDGNN